MDGWEKYYSTKRSTLMEWVDGTLKTKEWSEFGGYGIRVLEDGRLGFAYTECESKIGNAMEDAAIAARFSPKSTFSFQKRKRCQKVTTFDKKIAALDGEQLKDIIYEVRDGVACHAGKMRVVVEATTKKIHLTNSEGLDNGYSCTLFEIYTQAMKRNGFGFAHYNGIAMPKNPAEIGERAGMMAKAMIGAGKLKNGKYDVVFAPEALSGIIGILLPSFSGDRVRRKISKLAGMRGKKLFDNSITIYDDGLAAGSAVRPFDDEGTPSKCVTLIENGVIKNFLYDRETAALEGKVAEGSCSRAAFFTKPGIGPSNIVIKKGSWSSFEDEMEEFLLINSVHGLHTANQTSGDFGIEVDVAFHKKGDQKIPVRGFLLSGNIFELFRYVKGIEKRTEKYDNLISPRIAFSDVLVVA